MTYPEDYDGYEEFEKNTKTRLSRGIRQNARPSHMANTYLINHSVKISKLFLQTQLDKHPAIAAMCELVKMSIQNSKIQQL